MEHDDLRQAGLKVTNPRLKILKMLENAEPHHLRAEEIHDKLHHAGEEIGLATVYRVLTQFEQAGLVVRHNFEGGHCVFELDDGIHHDHLVCAECGIVKEFVDQMIEDRQTRIVKKNRFVMVGHVLTLYGICPNCQ